MDTYSMARVTLSWGYGQVYLWCTRRQDELLAELGTVLPCRIEPVARAAHDGDESWWRIDGLAGKQPMHSGGW